MISHRFRDQLDLEQAANRLASPMAFVPCPMFQSFSSAHQTQVQEVYRLAAEMTREQLQPVRYPQFSMN
ncbi:hypothetical protein PX52LOC_01935 [Limnoglobus roseus]|uniref:Uncharacterized protein n=1 Tax=Limnoglobus roseus TaxID=2598579 RepID=A0A5C1A8G1_9BACT|nr:hypothetical protein PX52LOC_01935 [Limnoglobus roseus]